MGSLHLLLLVCLSCLFSCNAFVIVDHSKHGTFLSKTSSILSHQPYPAELRRRRPSSSTSSTWILYGAIDDDETQTEEKGTTSADAKDQGDTAASEEVKEEEEPPKKEDPELVALKQEIANLESALKAKKRELFSARDKAEEYSKEGYARQVAEMENMRRARSMLNSSNRSSATATILAEFLPILERLNELRSEYATTSFGKQYDALPGALQSAFSELGVKEFTVDLGNKVDRYRMLVLDERFSEQYPKGTVMEVTGKKGLELQGNVIRMAECVMSLGPEPKDEEAAEAEAPSSSSDEVADEPGSEQT